MPALVALVIVIAGANAGAVVVVAGSTVVSMMAFVLMDKMDGAERRFLIFVPSKVMLIVLEGQSDSKGEVS